MKATRIVVLLVLLTLFSTPPLVATEPWDAPFAGNPQAILDAAKRIPVPASQPVIILLEQQIAIDTAGRITRSGLPSTYNCSSPHLSYMPGPKQGCSNYGAAHSNECSTGL